MSTQPIEKGLGQNNVPWILSRLWSLQSSAALQCFNVVDSCVYFCRLPTATDVFISFKHFFFFFFFHFKSSWRCAEHVSTATTQRISMYRTPELYLSKIFYCCIVLFFLVVVKLKSCIIKCNHLTLVCKTILTFLQLILKLHLRRGFGLCPWCY